MMSGSNTSRRRARVIASWVLSAALGIVLVGINRGALDAAGLPDGAQAALLAALAGCLWAVQLLYWRSLDEVAREVHKSAFFWSGLVVWTVLPITLSGVLIFDLRAGVLGEVDAIGGALFVMLLHALLYFAFWGVARLRLR
jgi:hypothetical protein